MNNYFSGNSKVLSNSHSRFHQVDSEDLTIAVNFWWQSDMMSGMPEHMDAYYLRRILKRYDVLSTSVLVVLPFIRNKLTFLSFPCLAAIES